MYKRQDDIIGTLAQFAEKNGIEVFIVTGDRDALQLASDNIKAVSYTHLDVYKRQCIYSKYDSKILV